MIKYRTAACTVFLMMKTLLFERCRRQCNLNKIINGKSVHLVGSSYTGKLRFSMHNLHTNLTSKQHWYCVHSISTDAAQIELHCTNYRQRFIEACSSNYGFHSSHSHETHLCWTARSRDIQYNISQYSTKKYV